MSTSAQEHLSRKHSRLLPADVLHLGTTGLRARPTRAFLSALGIAIGIAAMIAVIGISTSSHARLEKQLSALGTNLLTATPGESLTGKKTPLPADSLGKVERLSGVEKVTGTTILDVPVYRSRLSDPAATGGITTMVADQALTNVTSATLRSGSWLNPATGARPGVVLGSKAAERLGVVSPGTQVWLGGTAFTVVGILQPVALAPELDTAALIGSAVARTMFGFDGRLTTVYERSAGSQVETIRGLLGPTISPQAPDQVAVSRPSDALAASNAANSAFTGLLVGVGSIALLVGGIGVANTMIISVIERRREIGLRRALGATRGHIRIQFLAEAVILSTLGGGLGCALGALVTAGTARSNDWPYTLPPIILAVALLVTLAIGAVAGFWPAVRAARTPPTVALAS